MTTIYKIYPIYIFISSKSDRSNQTFCILTNTRALNYALSIFYSPLAKKFSNNYMRPLKES